MNYLLSAIIGYLLGSIPSAYIIVKKSHNKDVTSLGSGNMGALNSFEVSKSRLTGFLVLLSDFSKGALTVFLIKYFIEDSFAMIITGSISAVFSHCYTPWLKFKGGRGLATAAGCLLFVVPIVAILWMFLWSAAFLIKKDVHIGNIFATILTPVITFIVPELISYITLINKEPNSFVFTISVLILMLIVFSKHIEPLKIVIKNETNHRRKK